MGAEFKHLTWVHSERAALAAVMNEPDARIETWALCYTLTDAGMRFVATSKTGNEKSPQPDSVVPAARKVQGGRDETGDIVKSCG
jgi:hypothetical protein